MDDIDEKTTTLSNLSFSLSTAYYDLRELDANSDFTAIGKEIIDI